MAAKRPEVAVVDSQIPHYRAAFHTLLRQRLDEMGIDYTLVYGTPPGEARRKRDWTTLDFAHLRDNRVIRIGSKTLTWQPCLRLLASADLVIGAQQTSQLVNYPLWLRYLTGRQRFAFWGHGVNFQHTNASRLGERVKRFMSRRVHWWFAYNDTSVRVVRDLGFPVDRITSVQNAIDTRQLRQQMLAVTPAQRQALRERVGLRGEHVCIYVGGMYEEKRLPLLIEACDHVRDEIPDFEMVFLGGGQAEDLVAGAAAERDWMHFLGPTFDAEKAACLSISKLLLMPGLVGLAVLDSFTAAVPIVTLADSEHSPEIEYLEDGVNGRILPAGTDAPGYAKQVAELLRDETFRQRLVDGGADSSRRYTIEAMVERFAEGVRLALAAGMERRSSTDA